MVPIRVLIVDDAVVVRRLLSDIISKDRMLEVVGTAANGKIALDKIPTLKPHVIVLDLEMPVIPRRHRRAPIKAYCSHISGGDQRVALAHYNFWPASCCARQQGIR